MTDSGEPRNPATPNLPQIPTRVMVLKAIQQFPGIHKSVLQRTVNRSWGTISYHLNFLLTRGQVKTVWDRREVRYFLAGFPEERIHEIAASWHPLCMSILQVLRKSQPLTRHQLYRQVGGPHRAIVRGLGVLAWHNLVHLDDLGRWHDLRAPQAPPPPAGAAPPNGLSPLQPGTPAEPTLGAPPENDGPASLPTRPSFETFAPSARWAVYALIRQNPGICIRELATLASVRPNAVAYHVARLQKVARIVTLRQGRRVALFASDAEDGSRAFIALMRLPTVGVILRELATNPLSSARGLARKLDVSTHTVRWHLKRLAAHGLISLAAQTGARRRVELHPEVRSLLDSTAIVPPRREDLRPQPPEAVAGPEGMEPPSHPLQP